MKQFIGRVKRVFIPEGNDYQIINSNRIGFVIEKNSGEETLILKQDALNCEILKDDIVLITKQLISEKEFIDIEKVNGDFGD